MDGTSLCRKDRFLIPAVPLTGAPANKRQVSEPPESAGLRAGRVTGGYKSQLVPARVVKRV